MTALVSHVKHVARRLHRRIDEGGLPFPLPHGERLQRRHCLNAVAVQLGFRNWTHASTVLQLCEKTDRGTLMFHDSGGAIWNIWSASYTEAQEIRAQSGGFLLPYKHQFQIVESPYIELLELDPLHCDWEAIGQDWVEPKDPEAWQRITRRRIDVVLA